MARLLMMAAAALVANAAHAADFETAHAPSHVVVFSASAGLGVPVSGDADFDQPYGNFGADVQFASEHAILELSAAAATHTDRNAGTGAERFGDGHVFAAAHLVTRHASGAFGVFGGLTAQRHQQDSDYSNHIFGGVEAIGYRGDHAFLAQAGYFDPLRPADGTGTWYGGPFVRLGARHYVHEDARLAAELALAYGQFSAGQRSGWNAVWEVSYEHRSSGPYTTALFYRGHFVNDTSDSSASNRVVDTLFGVRFVINPLDTTIRERDMMVPFDAPNFHYALAWVDEL